MCIRDRLFVGQYLFPKAPPIDCPRFPLDWDALEKAIYFAENETDISAAWDIMMANIELELQ
eukprot:4062636-Pyramimonas_sp.AAC.1